MLGYELADLPLEATAISQEWSKLYSNKSALSSIQIQSLIDRALIHKELLRKVIINQ